MSRSNRATSIGGSGNAISLCVNKIISKEDEFRSGLKKIHASSKILADYLHVNDGVIEHLITNAKVEDEVVTHQFVVDQRERLKSLCARLVSSHREVDAFLYAIKSIRNDLPPNQIPTTSTAASIHNQDDRAIDYNHIISRKIQEYKDQQVSDGTLLDVDDEEIMRQCRQRLGEKDTRKKSRNTRDEGDDEDELEIMNRSSGQNDLKCPFTAQIFTRPMRNKVCNHVYDEESIKHHLRTNNRGNASCPIPGCTNKNVTIHQLEVDEEMKLRVRRFLAKAENSKRLRTENIAEDIDNAVGTTVIE